MADPSTRSSASHHEHPDTLSLSSSPPSVIPPPSMVATRSATSSSSDDHRSMITPATVSRGTSFLRSNVEDSGREDRHSESIPRLLPPRPQTRTDLARRQPAASASTSDPMSMTSHAQTPSSSSPANSTRPVPNSDGFRLRVRFGDTTEVSMTPVRRSSPQSTSRPPPLSDARQRAETQAAARRALRPVIPSPGDTPPRIVASGSTSGTGESSNRPVVRDNPTLAQIPTPPFGRTEGTDSSSASSRPDAAQEERRIRLETPHELLTRTNLRHLSGDIRGRPTPRPGREGTIADRVAARRGKLPLIDLSIEENVVPF